MDLTIFHRRIVQNDERFFGLFLGGRTLVGIICSLSEGLVVDTSCCFLKNFRSFPNPFLKRFDIVKYSR